jgi:hypothetical protein
MIGCTKARAMQTGRVLKENGLNETAQGRQMNRRVEIVVYSVDSRDSSGPIAATTDK